jgi:hypothetical protein
MKSVMSHTTSLTTIQQSFSLECFLISSTVTTESAILEANYWSKEYTQTSPMKDLAVLLWRVYTEEGAVARRSPEATCRLGCGEKSAGSPSHQDDQSMPPRRRSVPLAVAGINSER